MQAADRIRNVALVGHRGSGKTSLHEALLHEAGATTRLGSVADGTTVSDSDDDEKARGMSISASLASFDWRDVKVNLIDTPGEPSFIADALGALRVCESAVFVVNGVLGVEVGTQRLWQRAQELGVARLIYVNMLDRERAAFFRVLEALKDAFGPHVVATEIPIGSEHNTRGVIDLVDMKAYEYADGVCTEVPIPDDLADVAQEYREKLMDEVAENSESLMERYLEGEEISHEEIVTALEDGTDHGHIFPVTCGVATTRLGSNRLLDAIVDDLPSPVQHGGLQLDGMRLEPDADGEMFSYVFKTRADPYAGRINLFRVYQGTVTHDTQVLNTRTHHKERIGQLLVPQGKDVKQAEAFGPGDIGAVAKLKETRAGDWLAARDEPLQMPSIKLPAPVMAFAMEPKSKGDEDKVFTALRRLQEEDPTIDLHRDMQTGEQIVAGLSQIHVEVIVERMRARFGAEVTLKPPRVPYQETIRTGAKAHGRHKKQTGGRGQFGDCHIEIEPLAGGDFEFVNAIKGGVIPTGFIPAVEKGVLDAMSTGTVAGYPVKGVRVRLFDGSYHSVDSSEMAFKLAGSLAMKQALAQAGAVLLEPIMLLTASVPDESVGDVMGDLSSRRGRPLGTEAVGGMTEVKAEVPMAEILTYAPDLRSLTGGQGEYTMEFLRYEEVPAHLAQKVVEKAQEEEEVRAASGLATLQRRGPQPGHTHQPVRHRVRRLRAHAAAGRARRDLPGRRLAARGVRPVHGAGAARGLDPRVGRRRARAAAHAPRRARAVAARAPAGAPRACPRRAGGHGRGRRGRAARGRRDAASAAPPAPRARGAHQRRPQDAARAGGLQRLRPHAHGRRRGALARRPGRLRPAADRPPERGLDHGDVGAQLVPLRDRSLGRGRRRAARRPGRRAVGADARGAGSQRRGGRARRATSHVNT